MPSNSAISRKGGARRRRWTKVAFALLDDPVSTTSRAVPRMRIELRGPCRGVNPVDQRAQAVVAAAAGAIRQHSSPPRMVGKSSDGQRPKSTRVRLRRPVALSRTRPGLVIAVRARKKGGVTSFTGCLRPGARFAELAERLVGPVRIGHRSARLTTTDDDCVVGHAPPPRGELRPMGLNGCCHQSDHSE